MERLPDEALAKASLWLAIKFFLQPFTINHCPPPPFLSFISKNSKLTIQHCPPLLCANPISSLTYYSLLLSFKQFIYKLPSCEGTACISEPEFFLCNATHLDHEPLTLNPGTGRLIFKRPRQESLCKNETPLLDSWKTGVFFWKKGSYSTFTNSH